MIQRWRSFFGAHVPGYRKRKQTARGNALLGLFGGFLFAYIISEAALGRFMHPIHWTAAGTVAILFYVGSYLWLLRRYFTRQLHHRTQP